MVPPEEILGRTLLCTNLKSDIVFNGCSPPQSPLLQSDPSPIPNTHKRIHTHHPRSCLGISSVLYVPGHWHLSVSTSISLYLSALLSLLSLFSLSLGDNAELPKMVDVSLTLFLLNLDMSCFAKSVGLNQLADLDLHCAIKCEFYINNLVQGI